MAAPSRSIPRPGVAPLWRLPKPPDPSRVLALASALDIHPVAAAVLVSRGIDEPAKAKAFLEPDLALLYDPFLMKGMEESVERLRLAIERDEPVVVYGDYDVDGVTSVAVLMSFLRACGGRVEPYIPKRLVEGYGVNMGAVEELAGRGVQLLVTCDCGVTALAEIDRAASLGMEVIVVDHHRLGERLPRATVIDPHREDCRYPFSHLAAVGLTFKLVMALRRRLRDTGFFARKSRREPNLRDLLDLVALGTVSDVVPLIDENRILVVHGLKVMAEGRRVGLRALLAVAGVESASVSAGQVAFKLGPRLNAAGRLDDARAGLELLLCEDAFEAAKLANALEIANSKRQAIEQQVTEEALEQAARSDPAERGLVLSSIGWHAGVVGIVASRVVERFRRPTLVLGREDDSIRGSGRSLGGFHLFDALAACSEHLERFGGHGAAAGLQLSASKLEDFRAAFIGYCRRNVSDEDLLPVLDVVAELDPLSVDAGLCAAVERLAPFGAGNPAPVFVASGARMDDRRLIGKPGANGARHVKGRFGPTEAIGFGLGDAQPLEGAPLDVAYTLGFNFWRGESRPQIALRSLLPAGTARIQRGGGG